MLPTPIRLFYALRRLFIGMLNAPSRLQRLQVQIAQLQLELHRRHPPERIEDAEMCVFSQSGEDGIIQWLIRAIDVQARSFVEFGVEDYSESNTRFLLLNDDWRGLVLDSGKRNIAAIRHDPISWRHNLKAVQAMITAENINALLTDAGFIGPIGLLSIDIDGNDYWVWKAIRDVQPEIVVIEYNSRFGAERSVTIPYQADFQRFKAHYSGLYSGASLSALHKLGLEKGYALVGCNAAGTNAFFVRQDRLPAGLRARSVREAFRSSTMRQARDLRGALTLQSAEEEVALIESLPLEQV